MQNPNQLPQPSTFVVEAEDENIIFRRINSTGVLFILCRHFNIKNKLN